MNDNVIECRNLTHYYGKRLIYRDLSFDVPRGRILGLLGKNGTGKTTTINILSGYLRPLEGECRIFGEELRRLTPQTRQKIALLIEGHVQYSYMTIEEIERFYAPFYPRWNRDAYYALMEKLHVAPRQRISRMSCGQQSQVALGLILAQDAELLILDDFSMGLDPGYRRLFVEYLRDYARAEDKTVFLTSHIIQDMEKLIEECIIMDYGRIMVQMPVGELLSTFGRYMFTTPLSSLPDIEGCHHPQVTRGEGELFSFEAPDTVADRLRRSGIPFGKLTREKLNLEDAFIGLTGKY
ncbi:ABC transporter ATP-binding protein [Alistipes sp.]|uniref:ABC transporter ATP-binding protein n=1 Tax=Alistipes sp. TaxID=1872444 RepID=UPI0025BFF291|nr:ABC transporter ATP-binding protein [Alistipes sp.]